MPHKGFKQSAEVRAKHSLALKGRLHSPEHNAKVAAAKQTPEWKAKMSAALQGRVFSSEHRAKLSEAQRGEKNHEWRGGTTCLVGRGYRHAYAPDHPFAIKSHVMEHRLIMEAHLGRVLLPTEVVHHINGILTDNRIENLMLFSNQGEHVKHHKSQKKEA